MRASTVLTARAMSEGTTERDAVAFIEAAERSGRRRWVLPPGWDSLSVHVEVPRTHFAERHLAVRRDGPAPAFPEREVDRLRDERLNDLQQVMADARRRAEKAFPAVIYADAAAYARPLGGVEETVRPSRPGRARRPPCRPDAPEASTLIVCGDIEDLASMGSSSRPSVSWAAAEAGSARAHRAGCRRSAVGGSCSWIGPARRSRRSASDTWAPPRRIDDFHALSVTNALLGGLFNSRLNMLLREERGYTYGVHPGFDMRRAAGPFAVRCAVESDVTAPAIADIMAELGRIVRRSRSRTPSSSAARDYLIGVFPLRFETSAQVAGALSGLVVHGLPDDELDRYRPAVAAVSADDVRAAAAGAHPSRPSLDRGRGRRLEVRGAAA